MARRCFISFKAEDIGYKKYIQAHLQVDMIDHSLNSAIDSNDEDYVMKKIREEYLSDSTVTIFLIGAHCAENLGAYEQRYIKRELQASLYHREGNTQNGILGIVLPPVSQNIYRGSVQCATCGGNHHIVCIGDSTVVKEFSYNYYIPQTNKCAWSEDERFCVLVSWEEFIQDPEKYVEQAFQKRSEPIAEKTKVRP